MQEEYLGQNIKKLGFGLMRLPKNGEAIDVEQVKAMVDKFLAAGFTYFDTAWAYAGSEDAIRQALVERYPRESFQLATKNAAWINCKSREDAIKQFETSLEQTGAGYFDFYLLHNLGEPRTKAFDDYDMWSFIAEKKAEGKIRHIGFSFHSTPEALEELLIKHPEIEFVQLQINYADWENPEVKSRECYEMVRKYGKSLVIMEPVKGGLLAEPPEAVAKIFREAEPDSSYASWGIRFAAGLPGLITVLSGMSSLEQMEDNISYMQNFTALDEHQQETVKRAMDAMAKIPLIPCTSCNYCAKVCPNDIGISGTFAAMNMLKLYNNLPSAKAREQWLVSGHGHTNASECAKCGECEEACPQHIHIREELEKAAEALK